MYINQHCLDQIAAHAAQQQPHECCGLIVQLNDGINYWPCTNVSPQLNRFEIAAQDYAEAADSGKLRMIVHSHVNLSAEPSQADLHGCELSGLPWLIYSYPRGDYHVIVPNGFKLELIGRQFVWGLTDCFTLIRDYYRDLLSIELATPEGGYQPNFWKQGKTYYSRFKEWGFVELTEDQSLQPHDILLMQINSPDEPNHAAVYIGNGQILHHVENRLSGRVQYGGSWQKITRYRVRHQSLC